MKDKRTLYKNLACVSFCLFTFFMASIFVSETYYNRIINQQIQDLSLLKSSHFQEWGSVQAPSPVIHKFIPYVYDDNNQATLFNASIKYQYSFEYKNYTFTQGNTGNIRYLNTWKRQPIEQNQNNEQQKIKVFNVDAESVYNYDYYAPTVRQFALTYNVLYDSLKKQFLPLFYASYMFEYLFKDQKMVYSRVLKPLGLTVQKASAIYQHPVYGMNTPQLMTKWIQLSQSIDDESFYTLPFYHGLVNDIKLTNQQIMYITGPRSTIQGMLISIKNILKYKMNKLDDDRCQDDFCTDEQLIAGQLGVGFLTNQPIFTSTNINKYINEMNTTLLNKIEYSAFCQSRPDLEQCSGDDNTAAISFFVKNHFADFAEVQFLLNNLNNPQSLQAVYDLPPGEGESIVEYVRFLYNNTFNLPVNSNNNKMSINQQQQKQQTNNNNINNKIQTKPLTQQQNINIQAFKRSFTNYNHLQPILNNLQSILFVQLHTRAFYNKFILEDKKSCQQYYTNEFEQYKEDCSNKLPLKTVDDVRVYINMYLGLDTDKFMNSTTIDSKQLINAFFFNVQTSLLAQQLSTLSSDISLQYNCLSKTSCSQKQLLFKQWKNGQILNNLPKEYFPNQQQNNVTITSWDFDNKLKQVQPQLYKYLQVVPQQVQPQQILNSHSTGIYSLFNLMKVYNNKQGSLYKGLLNSDLLYYIQSVVMDVEFQGIHIELTMNEFLNSHYSPIIDKKRSIDPQMGGAPWLNPYVSVLKLSNQPQKFNYINSGIYDQQKLRSISQIEDNIYSSSTYQVFKSQEDDVTVTYTSQNKVSGTNLFGFQTKIQQNDNIKGYFDMIYQPQTMSFKQSIEWKNTNNEIINAYKFTIQDTKQFEVTVQQLANRTVQLSKDTYFVVEPNTGLTLQYYIKYTVLSKPFYTEYQRGANSSSSTKPSTSSQSSNTTTTSAYPLYQGQLYFTNDNTSNIVSISQDQHTLKILFLMGIILSSLSFLSFIIMLIMYRKARKSNKFGQQNKSLMSSQNGNGSLAY